MARPRAGAGLTRRPAAATMADMRTSPPFRADHVGSLLRPPDLLAASDDFAAGTDRAPPSCARSRTRRSPRPSGMQEEAGLQTATDGEFRRASWHMDFIYQLGGISQAPGNLAVRFQNESGADRVHPGGPARRRAGPPRPYDLRRRLPLPAVGGRARQHPEADHPVAEHGPLPRRPGRHRPVRVPGHGAVLVRPVRRLRAAGAGDRRARLHATSSSTTPAWPT